MASMPVALCGCFCLPRLSSDTRLPQSSAESSELASPNTVGDRSQYRSMGGSTSQSLRLGYSRRSMSLLGQEALEDILDNHEDSAYRDDAMVSNHMLKILWPYISEYATNIIKTNIEPAIQKQLGALGKHFKFDDAAHCHLGSKALEFASFHVNKTEQKTAEGTVENMVVTGDIHWEGDLSILTHIAQNVCIGIKGISLHGCLVFEFVGLRPAMPMFQGVRVYFINPPKVDLTFGGDHLTKLLNFSSIKTKLLEVLDSQICKALVVPNRFGKVLDKAADHFRILKPRPRGILKLILHRGEQLLAMDTHLFSKPSSDPYAVIRCGADKFTSPVVFETLNPTFNYTVTFQIGAVRHQRLRIDLWDLDKIKHDDFLGRVEVSVLDLVHSGNSSIRLELEDEHGKAGSSGCIWLSAEFRPLLLEPVATLIDDAAYVFVGIYWARDVPVSVDGTKFRVDAKCTHVFPEMHKEQEQRSKTKAPKHIGFAGNHGKDDLNQRLALLRKYVSQKNKAVPDEDLAAILDLPVELLSKGEIVSAFRRADVEFYHPFEFFVCEADKAEVSLELRRQEPSLHRMKNQMKTRLTASELSRERGLLGTYKFSVSEIAKAQGSTRVMEVKFKNDGGSIQLKVRAQVRRLGAPTSRWP